MLEAVELGELVIITGLVWRAAKAHTLLEILTERVQMLEEVEQERTTHELSTDE